MWRVRCGRFFQLSALQVEAAPEQDRIVVAIDPPVTGRKGSDDCGIVVCGVTMDGPPQDYHKLGTRSVGQPRWDSCRRCRGGVIYGHRERSRFYC